MKFLNKLTSLFATLAVIVNVGLFATSCSDSKEKLDFTRVEFALSDNDLDAMDEDKIILTINLDHPLTQDVKLGIKLEGNENNYVSLSSNLVEFNAGETSSSVEIRSNKNYEEIVPLTLKLSIDLDNTTIENVELIEEQSFVLKPEFSLDLDEDEKALLASYKQKTGFDFESLLGMVDVSLKIEYNSEDSEQFFKGNKQYTYTGKTFINLSDEATEDSFIFDMEDNPMGMTEWIKDVYYMQTFYNTEFWNTETGASGKICKLLNYDPKQPGDIEFDIEIDSLHFDISNIKDNKVNVENLVKYYKDSWGDELNTINFSYDFDLQDRLDKLVEEGATFVLNENGTNVEHTVKEYVDNEWFYINPMKYIATSSVMQDDWGEEPSLFVKPSGYIDFAARKMVFEFAIDFADSWGGYSKVTVEYNFPSKR